MRNRPVASTANQYKDVYGSQQKSTRTTVTVVLMILMILFVLLSLINGNWMTLIIFAPILLALIISLIVGRHADRSSTPVEPHDSPEAIFKEHGE